VIRQFFRQLVLFHHRENFYLSLQNCLLTAKNVLQNFFSAINQYGARRNSPTHLVHDAAAFQGRATMPWNKRMLDRKHFFFFFKLIS